MRGRQWWLRHARCLATASKTPQIALQAARKALVKNDLKCYNRSQARHSGPKSWMPRKPPNGAAPKAVRATRRGQGRRFSDEIETLLREQTILLQRDVARAAASRMRLKLIVMLSKLMGTLGGQGRRFSDEIETYDSLHLLTVPASIPYTRARLA